MSSPRVSLKNCCVGNLHMCRQRPLQFVSSKKRHRSAYTPPACRSSRTSYLLGPTRNLKNGGVKIAVKKGAQNHGAMNVLYTGGTNGPAMVARQVLTIFCWSSAVTPG